jgi:hypothetical protein
MSMSFQRPAVGKTIVVLNATAPSMLAAAFRTSASTCPLGW